MDSLPIRTERLRLRRLRAGDAPMVSEHVADWDVAKQTGDTPFPYVEADARDWIARELRVWMRGRGCALAVELDDCKTFVGTISLRLRRAHRIWRRGEIGYWIGKPFWGEGYGTEAVSTALWWFSDLFEVRKVEALTFVENSGSIRVLEKTGFRMAGESKKDYPDRGGLRLVRRYEWTRPVTLR